ncbi:MAG: ferritin-like domain-containing protein [Cellulomonadaceae bacterium]|jgi:hypothetical protein|nr:ferritin-like domain-containing protein [Cellulomonadaceae bacterium]
MDTARHADTAVALAGLGAYARLRLFSLVSQEVWNAPTIETAHLLVKRSISIGQQEQKLVDVAAAHGADVTAAMAPFTGVLDTFVTRTRTEDWWENLLKAVVGHGVLRDFLRLLSRGLDADIAAQFTEVLKEDGEEDQVSFRLLRDAVAADSVLGSRLGLWGRRVMGETLKLSVDMMARSPLVDSLAVTVAAQADVDGVDFTTTMQATSAARAWVLKHITAEHSARMESLGLEP